MENSNIGFVIKFLAFADLSHYISSLWWYVNNSRSMPASLETNSDSELLWNNFNYDKSYNEGDKNQNFAISVFYLSSCLIKLCLFICPFEYNKSITVPSISTNFTYQACAGV